MALQENYFPLSHFDDFIFLNIGNEYCAPGHFNGPKMRDMKIFHYIFSGKGIFECMGKTYHLSANQGFFIEQNVPIYYKADEEDPWHYGWIGIGGKQATSIFNKLFLTPQTPIYYAHPSADLYPAFKNCIYQCKVGTSNDIFAALFSYVAALEKNSVRQISSKQKFKPSYAEEAEQYILLNYHSNDVKIEKIADAVGINRRYLTRLFVAKFHCSPQQYLLRLRMERAKSFLQTTNYSVLTVANSVGYPSIDAFSKIYKSYFGCAPSQTRKLSKSLAFTQKK